jgi:hypothetical protein
VFCHFPNKLRINLVGLVCFFPVDSEQYYWGYFRESLREEQWIIKRRNLTWILSLVSLLLMKVKEEIATTTTLLLVFHINSQK